MRLWLTLSATAMLIPAVANASDYPRSTRLHLEIAQLNDRIETLESELVIARNSAPVHHQQVAEAAATPAKPKARLNPNLVRMQAVPKGDAEDQAAKAEAEAKVVASATVPEITISPLPALVPAVEVPELRSSLDDAEPVEAAEDTIKADDFDPEAGEDDLIRLDPETGRPMVTPAPKSEEPQSKSTCTDKDPCANAPKDKEAMVTPPKKDRHSRRNRDTRVSWR